MNVGFEVTCPAIELGVRNPQHQYLCSSREEQAAGVRRKLQVRHRCSAGWQGCAEQQGPTCFTGKTQLGSTEGAASASIQALLHWQFPYCNYCTVGNKPRATETYRLSRKGQMNRDWKNWNNLVPGGIHERKEYLYWNMAFLQKNHFWALSYFTVLYLSINIWINKIKSRTFKISNYIMNICL